MVRRAPASPSSVSSSELSEDLVAALSQNSDEGIPGGMSDTGDLTEDPRDAEGEVEVEEEEEEEEEDELLSTAESELSDEQAEREEEEEEPQAANSRVRIKLKINPSNKNFKPDSEEEEAPVNIKMTARQAAKARGSSFGLESLPMRAVAKVVSVEEAALERSEKARKRKNLSDQKLEDEKTDTINRLLKKQATKSKKNISNELDNNALQSGEPSALPSPVPPTMSRWTSNSSGSTLSLPIAWIQS